MTDLESRAFRESIFHIASLIQSELDARDHPKALTALLALKRVADLRASGDLAGFLAYAPVWDEICTAQSPGDALTAAYSRLEEAHPGEKNWFDALIFSPTRDTLWKKVVSLVSEFSFLDADPEVFSEMLLQFYRESPGSFETPRDLAHLLAGLLEPERGASIFAPFCQDGAILIEVAREHGTRGITLYAQTPNDYSRLVTALVLLVHNCPDVHVATGDPILTPRFRQDERCLMVFDRVVGTIPAGAMDWGSEGMQRDPYLRFVYGVPPRTSRDYAYLSHAIASLTEGGRLVAVVPSGVLFRSARTEKDIRANIVSRDRVEAVIALPLRIFPSTAVPFAILVIAAGKVTERRDRTIFIDASRSFLAGRGRSILRGEDITTVLDAYTTFTTVEGFSAVATIDEIAAQDFNLEVSRYVRPVPSEEQAEPFDIDAAIAELKTIRERKEDALNRFLESVTRLEHEQR
ncbi:hypothetical protein E2N92_00675 [Methanofollis formosanus]|uniref:site-specific DNA-methyltransferase (adenine-specific) n=1 Tax=Methanofollis formosanus TaxID=299308 RepID=A0A8G1EFN3_9EURY|nr:N-6 DNA methylase [Methanofollis formosanus]QYZ78047.1 hypothetical protein E2N92_00675 [Methanofollis formosanus]